MKHKKGKDLKRKPIWVFGLYERETKKCIFVVVKSRDALSLLNVIYHHVNPGSIIYSDCWKSYNRIASLDREYIHHTVNHTYHFKDPETGTHTNGIESIWCSAKIHIKKMRGVRRQYLQAHLDEYVWRHNNSLSRFQCFEAILKAIKEVFPVDEDPNIM